MYSFTHETTPRQTAIERALVILNSAGILTDLNRDIVISHEDPVTVRDAIVLLNVKNLLTQLEASEHLCTILLLQDPTAVANALVVLNEKNLLTYENIKDVVADGEPLELAEAIVESVSHINGTKVLSQYPKRSARQTATITLPKSVRKSHAERLPHDLETLKSDIDTLIQLKNSNRLSQVNIRLALNDDSDLTTMLKSLSLSDARGSKAMLQYPTKQTAVIPSPEPVPTIGLKRPRGDFFCKLPKSIAKTQQHLLTPAEMLSEMLSELTDSGLFIGEQGQNNFDTIITHKFPVDVAKALIELKKNDLLAGEQGQVNFAVTVTHRYPRELAPALIFLQKSGLLADNQAQKNFDAIVGHEHPMKVAYAFIQLKEADRLSEDNINALLEVAPEDLEELIQCLLLSDVVSAHL